MVGAKDRIKLLRENGFKFYWAKDVYYNSSTKQVVSCQFVESATDDKFMEVTDELWRFYFLAEPSKETVKGIVDLLPKGNAQEIEKLINLLQNELKYAI